MLHLMQRGSSLLSRYTSSFVIAAAAVACIAFVIVLFTVIIPPVKYNAAAALMNDGNYEEAGQYLKSCFSSCSLPEFIC